VEEFVYLKTILSDYKTYFSNLESIIIDEETIFRRQEIANIYYDLITDLQIKLLKLYDDHSLIVKRNNEVKLYGNGADLFENCLPPNVTKIYVNIGYQFQIGSEIISKCDIPLRYNNLPVNLKSINLVLDYGYAQGQYDRISVNISKGNISLPFNTKINLFLRLPEFQKVPTLTKLEYDSEEKFVLKYRNVIIDNHLKLNNNIELKKVDDTGNLYYTIKKEFYDNNQEILKKFFKR